MADCPNPFSEIVPAAVLGSFAIFKSYFSPPFSWSSKTIFELLTRGQYHNIVSHFIFLFKPYGRPYDNKARLNQEPFQCRYISFFPFCLSSRPPWPLYWGQSKAITLVMFLFCFIFLQKNFYFVLIIDCYPQFFADIRIKSYWEAVDKVETPV